MSSPSAPQHVSVPEGPLMFHTWGSTRWVWISETCRNTIFLSLIAELAAESTWASRFWSSGRSDVLKAAQQTSLLRPPVLVAACRAEISLVGCTAFLLPY